MKHNHFLNEKEVVLEEIAQHNDLPEEQIFQRLITNCWGTQAYGKPILISSYSYLNNFIVKNKLGLASKPNDTKKLIYNINKVFNMNEHNKKKIYFSSKKIYEKLFEINVVTKKLEMYLYMAKKKIC